ncbi:MAG: hypothetical protein IH977_12790 [Nitrospinae bacterium]|nr:hypothetical protein [Nitrospinota bacterium]
MWDFSWQIMPFHPYFCRYFFMLKGLNLVPFESDPYSLLWDLRCLAREKLVAFMQENDPQGLPKFPAELKQQ